ncbi:hydrolase [Spirochaetia bacterium]|nr:hydrolase [Spirochaetia bacterium]
MKKSQAVICTILIFALMAGCATRTAFVREDNAGSILIYGDSITWGYVPLAKLPFERYPFSVRWTGILQKELGSGYTIIEEGLNSRTAGVDDFPELDPGIQGDLNLNGRPSFLPIIHSHEPLALIVIFLGANDVRPYQKQTLEDIRNSITQLIRIAKLGAYISSPKILLVAPPPLGPGQHEGLNSIFEGGGYELSAQLAPLYREIALSEGIEFFDAGSAASVKDSIDGVHFDKEENQKFGKALAVKIREILP